MRNLLLATLGALLLAGCASLNSDTGISSVPCTYRFKMLTRPEDQARVENAIRSVALGGLVTKTGTVTYPEYKFRVSRLADLDTLHPKLIYNNSGNPISSMRRQVLNAKTAGVEVSFDSTDLSGSAVTYVTFHVKPGSRLYYKDPGMAEEDITAKVDKTGKVVFPVALKEGQKYIYARAIKDRVERYIRINIFTSQAQDIKASEYR
jgi:hypothetical protein